MSNCDVVLKRVFHKGYICFELPTDSALLANLRDVLKLCKDKHNDFVRVILKPPYKKRTIKQNSLVHVYLQQIANYTGEDLESVKVYCKQKAVARGYPVKTDSAGNPIISKLTGNMIPISSADCNTKELSYLIEEALQLGAELGIILKSEL